MKTMSSLPSTTQIKDSAVNHPNAAESASHIKDWPVDDQPQEKLFTKGVGALSDSELLSILIGPGNRNLNAVDIARNVLNGHQNSLYHLARRSIHDIMKIKGMSRVKAARIVAAIELGRRKQSALSPVRPTITNSVEAVHYLEPLLCDLTYEIFGVMYFDPSKKLLQFEIVSRGGITAAIVDPRIVFKNALSLAAVSIIACHNHPSGNPSPSTKDRHLTLQLRDAGKLLDIKLLDHIILAGSTYYSFADAGALN